VSNPVFVEESLTQSLTSTIRHTTFLLCLMTIAMSSCRIVNELECIENRVSDITWRLEHEPAYAPRPLVATPEASLPKRD
jgi:hypothetical protein